MSKNEKEHAIVTGGRKYYVKKKVCNHWFPKAKSNDFESFPQFGVPLVRYTISGKADRANITYRVKPSDFDIDGLCRDSYIALKEEMFAYEKKSVDQVYIDGVKNKILFFGNEFQNSDIYEAEDRIFRDMTTAEEKFYVKESALGSGYFMYAPANEINKLQQIPKELLRAVTDNMSAIKRVLYCGSTLPLDKKKLKCSKYCSGNLYDLSLKGCKDPYWLDAAFTKFLTNPNEFPEKLLTIMYDLDLRSCVLGDLEMLAGLQRNHYFDICGKQPKWAPKDMRFMNAIFLMRSVFNGKYYLYSYQSRTKHPFISPAYARQIYLITNPSALRYLIDYDVNELQLDSINYHCGFRRTLGF